ncbi:polysaccharide biosynthesis tyrosine autokinase [Cobetia crustatorum]|uniref:Polysaccharide biosynthesis tyrosine autokinase n=1 Tax=Cobetia crustatorum TaxID=553385 RepID=A0A558HNM0_9GAMM|nr:polysaccharide biosynthesis tyrosine autokinase [Cobetia crustatorum]TVU70732.1 polysaccharide biosynthesis tyrosine autokinase [Cobetia crustatorum]
MSIRNSQPSRQPASSEASTVPVRTSLDLGRMLGQLYDSRLTLALITGTFSVLAVLYALLATPIYKADSLVQVEESGGNMNPLRDIPSMLRGEAPPSESEIQILTSRLVLGKAVQDEQLDLVVKPYQYPLIGNFLHSHEFTRPSWMSGSSMVWAGESLEVASLDVPKAWENVPLTLVALGGAQEGATQYELRYDGDVLGKGVVGEAQRFDGPLGEVTLEVTALSAGEGAEFTLMHQSTLEATNALRSRFAVAEMGKETGVLGLALVGEDPLHTQQVLKRITETYQQQNIDRQSAEAEKSLEFLKEQVPTVREKLQQAEERLNAYRGESDSVNLDLETKSVLDQLVDIDNQLNKTQLEEAELSGKFNSSHPSYVALRQKRADLQRTRKALEKQIEDLPDTQQEILRLQREVEVNQQIYVQLLNKTQEMNIAQASTIGNIRILDEAVAQPHPVSPRKAIIVVIATLLGGTLGVVFVLMRSLLHRGIETPSELTDLGLNVHATLPLSEEQARLNRRMARGLKRFSAFKASKAGKNAPAAGGTVAPGLLAIRNPADLSIEGLRGLRTSLHFAMMEATNNRLMICGPSPGIGKSFVSANLAAVCAQAGNRVLVIDADMRRGHVHQSMAGNQQGVVAPGLSDYLLGKAERDTIVRSIVDESLTVAGSDTGSSSLSYVARGTSPNNPSELLLQARFSELLEWASAHFDMVIVDTPPILAVTDAAIVGKLCGVSVMVTRFMHNSPKEIEAALERFASSGVTVDGAILNAVERKATTTYSYGYSYHDYQYQGSGNA